MNTTKARIDRLTAEAVAFICRAEPFALKMDARGGLQIREIIQIRLLQE